MKYDVEILWDHLFPGEYSQDLFWAKSEDIGIDVGFYPEDDPVNGEYRIVVCQNNYFCHLPAN